MDVGKPLKTEIELKHRPLTPFRILRGLICLTVILSTAFMFLVFFAPLVAGLLRVCSIHYSRKVAAFFFGLWLALWPFLFEKINKTNLFFSGEHVPAGERVLLIANHRTEVDWMYLWDLALRKGRLGYIKYILKNSLMKLPIFGWAFNVFEFIPLERKWETDEPIMHQMLLTFTSHQDPLWLALFPEGTDFTLISKCYLHVVVPNYMVANYWPTTGASTPVTIYCLAMLYNEKAPRVLHFMKFHADREQKCASSQNFAAENGLPVLKNVLLPKTKGFCACLDTLRSSLDAVYDVTIAYKNSCPDLMDNVFGVDPSEVHINIRRIPLKEIPVPEEEASAWLMDAFRRKDQLLTYFNTKGHFPNQRTEAELSTVKCLINCTLVIVLTGIFTYFAFVSTWVRVYITLSCVYLSSVTYFNFRPLPLLDFIKSKEKY